MGWTLDLERARAHLREVKLTGGDVNRADTVLNKVNIVTSYPSLRSELKKELYSDFLKAQLYLMRYRQYLMAANILRQEDDDEAR